VRRLLTDAVRRKGIRVLLSHEAIETSSDKGEKILKCRHEGHMVQVPFDECAWCTQAAAPEFLVRSRRPAVLRRFHAIDARRLRESRRWVVSFSILRPFGPRRATAMLRAGAERSGLRRPRLPQDEPQTAVSPEQHTNEGLRGRRL